MRCPQCQNNDDKVLETRILANGAMIRRRRECMQCDFRFTSYEHIEEQKLSVKKKNNRREPFDRSKLETGLQIAVKKRPIPTNQITSILDEIEETILLHAGNSKEVESSFLGELVIAKLQEIDTVAYLRFASVYRNFESIEQFMEEITQINNHAKESLKKTKRSKKNH